MNFWPMVSVTAEQTVESSRVIYLVENQRFPNVWLWCISLFHVEMILQYGRPSGSSRSVSLRFAWQGGKARILEKGWACPVSTVLSATFPQKHDLDSEAKPPLQKLYAKCNKFGSYKICRCTCRCGHIFGSTSIVSLSSAERKASW